MNDTIICSHKSPVPCLCHVTRWIRAFRAHNLAGLRVSSPQVQVYCNVQGTDGDFYSEERFWRLWCESWAQRHICGLKWWCLDRNWDTLLHHLATCSPKWVANSVYTPGWVETASSKQLLPLALLRIANWFSHEIYRHLKVSYVML